MNELAAEPKWKGGSDAQAWDLTSQKWVNCIVKNLSKDGTLKGHYPCNLEEGIGSKFITLNNLRERPPPALFRSPLMAKSSVTQKPAGGDPLAQASSEEKAGKEDGGLERKTGSHSHHTNSALKDMLKVRSTKIVECTLQWKKESGSLIAHAAGAKQDANEQVVSGAETSASTFKAAVKKPLKKVALVPRFAKPPLIDKAPAWNPRQHRGGSSSSSSSSSSSRHFYNIMQSSIQSSSDGNKQNSGGEEKEDEEEEEEEAEEEEEEEEEEEASSSQQNSLSSLSASNGNGNGKTNAAKKRKAPVKQEESANPSRKQPFRPMRGYAEHVDEKMKASNNAKKWSGMSKAQAYDRGKWWDVKVSIKKGQFQQDPKYQYNVVFEITGCEADVPVKYLRDRPKLTPEQQAIHDLKKKEERERREALERRASEREEKKFKVGQPHVQAKWKSSWYDVQVKERIDDQKYIVKFFVDGKTATVRNAQMRTHETAEKVEGSNKLDSETESDDGNADARSLKTNSSHSTSNSRSSSSTASSKASRGSIARDITDGPTPDLTAAQLLAMETVFNRSRAPSPAPPGLGLPPAVSGFRSPSPGPEPIDAFRIRLGLAAGVAAGIGAGAGLAKIESIEEGLGILIEDGVPANRLARAISLFGVIPHVEDAYRLAQYCGALEEHQTAE